MFKKTLLLITLIALSANRRITSRLKQRRRNNTENSKNQNDRSHLDEAQIQTEISLNPSSDRQVHSFEKQSEDQSTGQPETSKGDRGDDLKNRKKEKVKSLIDKFEKRLQTPLEKEPLSHKPDPENRRLVEEYWTEVVSKNFKDHQQNPSQTNFLTNKIVKISENLYDFVIKDSPRVTVRIEEQNLKNETPKKQKEVFENRTEILEHLRNAYFNKIKFYGGAKAEIIYSLRAPFTVPLSFRLSKNLKEPSIALIKHELTVQEVYAVMQETQTEEKPYRLFYFYIFQQMLKSVKFIYVNGVKHGNLSLKDFYYSRKLEGNFTSSDDNNSLSFGKIQIQIGNFEKATWTENFVTQQKSSITEQKPEDLGQQSNEQDIQKVAGLIIEMLKVIKPHSAIETHKFKTNKVVNRQTRPKEVFTEQMLSITAENGKHWFIDEVIAQLEVLKKEGTMSKLEYILKAFGKYIELKHEMDA